MANEQAIVALVVEGDGLAAKIQDKVEVDLRSVSRAGRSAHGAAKEAEETAHKAHDAVTELAHETRHTIRHLRHSVHIVDKVIEKAVGSGLLGEVGEVAGAGLTTALAADRFARFLPGYGQLARVPIAALAFGFGAVSQAWKGIGDEDKKEARTERKEERIAHRIERQEEREEEREQRLADRIEKKLIEKTEKDVHYLMRARAESTLRANQSFGKNGQPPR